MIIYNRAYAIIVVDKWKLFGYWIDLFDKNVNIKMSLTESLIIKWTEKINKLKIIIDL